MIDGNKAVFLPIDDRILNLYNGYILNGELLPDVKKSKIYTETKYYVFDNSISKTELRIRIIFIIPLAPVFTLILLIAAPFHKFDQLLSIIKYRIDYFSCFFFKKKKELRTHRILKKKYEGAVEENIPAFLNHCKTNFAKVYLYSYKNPSQEEQVKIETLIQLGLISSCPTISRLSDLIPLLKTERVSLRNSLLLIKDVSEKQEADLLGFFSGNGYKMRNVHLFTKQKLSWDEGDCELEWNRRDTILSLKSEIEYYLKAETNSFLLNNFILFIEDKQDEFLNDYIQNNLKSINDKLEQKGMTLIYFPSFQSGNVPITESILEFVRYRIPIMYSLSDSELNEALQIVLQNISPDEFYKLVLEELELPFFKRPCLLRSISGGFSYTENTFTYKHLEYQTKEDLDIIFEEYLQRVKIPNDNEGVLYRKIPDPDEYDADWSFRDESNELSNELKLKIDAIKSEGKYGVLAEAIIYMLETIKDEKPEIIRKIMPLIEKKKLLESKVTLSPVLIDKHYKIFLPDFGNMEVKMHALPKTVYILFLRHPDGIRFKELFQHKKELLEIYNKVTNKYEKDEIEKAIDDLVDMTNPSINQKCARIREAFRNIMDENTAKYYFIDGLNGKPKKISLPRNLIDIRY